MIKLCYRLSGQKGIEMSKTEYLYGMKMRGFSLGCQPMKGLIRRDDCVTGEYWDLLYYDRKLTKEEVANYELEFIAKK